MTERTCLPQGGRREEVNNEQGDAARNLARRLADIITAAMRAGASATSVLGALRHLQLVMEQTILEEHGTKNSAEGGKK